MKKQNSAIPFHMWVLIFLLVFLYGWVANFTKLVILAIENTELTTMFLARIVGVFLAPFGSILGYF
jgi:hypothetical protein